MRRAAAAVVVIWCAGVAGGQAPAAPAAAGDPAEGHTSREKTVIWLAPAADFYPQYVADPQRPQGALMLAGFVDSDIPQSGDRRFLLRLGGRFAIVRWHPVDDPDHGWQLDFEGGFFGLFDVDNNLDNIGWDGLFGLTLSHRTGGPLSFTVGTRHDSAHVGDEYAERTGRQRVGYTREEFVAGVSLELGRRWRSYVEAGYDPGLDQPQEPLRLQLGLEHDGKRRFMGDRLGWYAAMDVTVFEELDWQPNTTLQIGVAYPTGRGTSRYRVALEVASGRSVLGEFSTYDETFVALGWYFDF